MDSLGNDLSIANMSIPGTHDTMARTTSFPWAWCQSLSLENQLNIGIRYFDIRYRHASCSSGNTLWIYHGICYQNCSLGQCLSEIEKFLGQHTRECVIVRLKREGRDGDCSEIQDILNNFRNDLFWLSAEIPTLGEARGKIVILRDFHRQTSAYVQHLSFGIPYVSLNIEDQFAQWDILDRFRLTREHLEEAQDNIDLNQLFLTHSSAVICHIGIPRESARQINPMLFAFIGDRMKTPGQFGIIAMDYPGPVLIQNIIDKNKNG